MKEQTCGIVVRANLLTVAQSSERRVFICQVLVMALALMGVLMPGRLAVGQCDPGWVSGIGVSGLDGQVNAVLALPGGGVVAGGKFNNAGGEAANRVALWNGSAWSALGAGINGSVNALAVLPNGDAVAGGVFSTAGGVSASSIARWNGTSWSALGTGIDGPVYALAVMPNGDLIAGGAFTTAGGVQANSIARWDGLSWSALGAGIEGSVYALAVLPVSGSIVAGGFIATAGGLPVNYVARWDGSSWSPLGVGTNRFILALTSVRTPGGGEDLYAGGFFTQAGGVPANYIARWNGTAWSALGTGTGYFVTALGVLPDGAGGASVIAAGQFGSAGAETVWGVGRWDGSAWFALGGYTDQLINAISVRPDGAGGGDLYVAGDLAEAGNILYEPDPVEKIAQYRFGPGLPRVTAQPVGGSRCTGGEATLEVLTGGSGSTLSYQWRKGGVPIDATVNPSAASARLAISNLRSADAGSYDCVISNACGSTTSALAVLSVGSCGCGLSDVAGPGQSIGADGSLTADDIIVFLNWFFAGDSRGDVAGAGQSSVPDGQFTADDIIVFLNRFFAGC